MLTEIRFSLKLSEKTLRAFDQQGATSPEEVKDALVEKLREHIEEVREEASDDEDDQ